MKIRTSAMMTDQLLQDNRWYLVAEEKNQAYYSSSLLTEKRTVQLAESGRILVTAV